MGSKIDKINISAFEYSRSIIPQISTLCNSFLAACNLTTFAYGKFFNNEKFFFLSNSITWIEFFFMEVDTIEGSALHGAFRNAPLGRPIHAFWSSAPQDRLIQALKHFGVCNGFDIYYRNCDSIEMWSFSTSHAQSKEIDNFYLNNLKLLHRFCLYFKDKASSIIKNIDENKLAVFRKKLDVSFHISLSWMCDITSFLSLNQLDIQTNQGPISFTKREIECLLLLSQGKSLKEIATDLEISLDTVTFHINNIKDKTGYLNRSRLIKLVNETLLSWL